LSFILDALRKSEHERQRQTGPGIADLQPVSIQQRLPLWAIGLGALLLINITVVLILVLRGQSKPIEVPAATTPAPAAVAPATPTGQPSTPAPQPTSAPPIVAQAPAAEPYVLPAPELPQGAMSANTQPPQAGFPQDATSLPAVAPSRLRSDPQLASRPIAEEPPDSGNEENLPSLNDVQMQGAARVPELHLDIHVYSGAPAERFVFMNMRKYREGDTTPEGTRIERITREGVVLNHHGLRFKMPRQ